MAYKIHPGIGVARMGDSPATYLGPDVPGAVIAPAAGFRDAECRIKRQEGEFRVFDHPSSGSPTELVLGGGTSITWRVRFAVARDFNNITPIAYAAAELSISAPGTAVFPPSPAHPLVEIEMLPSGRLRVRSAIFDAGSSSVGSGDRCEGYVRADVTTAAGTSPAAESWALILQPDYAPGKLPTTSAIELLRTTLWPALPPTDASLPLTDRLDRGPLSYMGSGGWDLGGQLSGLALADFAEPFRFSPGGPPHNLRSTTLTRWHDDLNGCHWANEVNTDLGQPTPARGDDWKLRGFLALQPDATLAYVDWCPEINAPSSVNLYQVPQGSERAVPIRLRIGNCVDPITVSGTFSGAASIALVSASSTVPTVNENTEIPHTVWAIFNAGTSAALGPVSGTLVLDFGGLRSASLTVHAEVVAPSPTAMALVIDCSTSMTLSRGDGLSRLDGLKDAVDVIVDVARPGDAIAVAPFSSSALPHLNAQVLGNGDSNDESAGGSRYAVREFVRSQNVVADTSIGAGLVSGRARLAASGIANRALIVVSDGFENTAPMIDDVADTIDARTFAVGIGSAFEPALRALTLENEGFTTIVGSPVSSGNRYTLEKYLLAILSGATNGDSLLDPEGMVHPGGVERIPFLVSDAELGLDLIVISNQASALRLGVEGPNGELASFEQLRSAPGARVRRTPRVGHAALPLPLRSPSGATWGAGSWTLLVAAGGGREQDGQWRSEALLAAPPAVVAQGPISYAAQINATTALRMRADLLPRAGVIELEATFNRAGAPLERQPRVTVELAGPLGHHSTLALQPDQYGLHKASIASARPGSYTATFRAFGETAGGSRFQRERTIEDFVRHPRDPQRREPGCPEPAQRCRSALDDLLRCLKDCAKPWKRC